MSATPAAPDIRSLTELCAEVIGAGSVAPDDNFFDAGGDSVSAVRFVVLLEERWGVNLDIFAVLAAGSLKEIHDRMATAVRGRNTAERPL